MAVCQNSCFSQFYRSRIDVLKIAQLLGLVILCQFLSWEKIERIERKVDSQNPTLSRDDRADSGLGPGGHPGSKTTFTHQIPPFFTNLNFLNFALGF